MFKVRLKINVQLIKLRLKIKVVVLRPLLSFTAISNQTSFDKGRELPVHTRPRGDQQQSPLGSPLPPLNILVTYKFYQATLDQGRGASPTPEPRGKALAPLGNPSAPQTKLHALSTGLILQQKSPNGSDGTSMSPRA
jgi:hypothetical protein